MRCIIVFAHITARSLLASWGFDAAAIRSSTLLHCQATISDYGFDPLLVDPVRLIDWNRTPPSRLPQEAKKTKLKWDSLGHAPNGPKLADDTTLRKCKMLYEHLVKNGQPQKTLRVGLLSSPCRTPRDNLEGHLDCLNNSFKLKRETLDVLLRLDDIPFKSDDDKARGKMILEKQLQSIDQRIDTWSTTVANCEAAIIQQGEWH